MESLRSFAVNALKGGHVKNYVQVFSMTALHCNDRDLLFPKLFDCSIYAKHTQFYVLVSISESPVSVV